jgi:hypothetical protein
VGKDDMNIVFEDVENGDPVFAGRFHTDMMAVIFEKPVTESDQVGI